MAPSQISDCVDSLLEQVRQGLPGDRAAQEAHGQDCGGDISDNHRSSSFIGEFAERSTKKSLQSRCYRIVTGETHLGVYLSSGQPPAHEALDLGGQAEIGSAELRQCR